MSTRTAGALLREARGRAKLSQAALGRRAGVTQSVVSAYESGGRQPSLPTLRRLVEATGYALEVRIHSPSSRLRRLTGPLGQRVRQHRTEIARIADSHGASNVRVFGSVARGEDSADSDIDLLVDLAAGTGLVGLGRLEQELRRLLDADVDVVPADSLKPGVVIDVMDEVVSL